MLLVMSFITFSAIHLTPGDILATYKFDVNVSQDEIERLERQYRFDTPFYAQYFHWLRNIFFEWHDRQAEIEQEAAAEIAGIINAHLPGKEMHDANSLHRASVRIWRELNSLDGKAEEAEDGEPADGDDEPASTPGETAENADGTTENAESNESDETDETGETPETIETIETGETAETIETGETGEAGETVDGVEAAETDKAEHVAEVLPPDRLARLAGSLHEQLQRIWKPDDGDYDATMAGLAEKLDVWFAEYSRRGDTRPFLQRVRGYFPTRVRLDLGYSFVHKVPVTDVLGSRLANTLILSAISLVLVWAIAIPVGTYCAVNQYSFGDKVLSFVAFIGMSFPSFFLALILLYLVSLTGWLPIGGLTSPNHNLLGFFGRIGDVAAHMLVPMLVIVTGSLAGMQRLMRGNMLDVLRQQYVTTARAKGLPEKDVIYNHALRNAVNPMITIFGYQLSGLLSGVALTEMITSYPGLGSLMLEAVQAKDVFLVITSMLMGGVLLILGNLVADILLSVADPRISYD